VDDQHPTVPTWTPAPPPERRRRLGPGLAAVAMAAVVLFGGVGLFAARQMAATGTGATSPEAAASGLLAALDRKNLDRAADYLDNEERLLVGTYRDRVVAAVAGRLTGAPGDQLTDLDLTARDVRFRRVADSGADGVAVVELVAGTVGGRGPRGAKLELPAAELNRRLAQETKGAVTALQVVTVRADDRWHVSLLATAAEHARAAGSGGQPDWALLGARDQAAGGAASPEAAVRELAASLGNNPDQAVDRLSPGERLVLRAYQRSAPAGTLPDPNELGLSVRGLTTRTERIGDDVAKVHLTGGTLRRPPAAAGSEPPDLDRLGAELGVDPYVVTIQRDGTWYPSLVFTATDWMLTRTERERP
jgi:DNA-binding NarL/FixJ family response regulator